MKRSFYARQPMKVPDKRGIEKLKESFKKLKEAQDKNKLAKAMRIWVERDTKIHALNYWYYRWFTNRFELFLINYSPYVQNGKGDENAN